MFLFFSVTGSQNAGMCMRPF